jgi:polynucleotide 5'-hydroxyl-kinase GRC3/NOL9
MSHVHAPQDWWEAAETILLQQPRVIFMLGGGDVGKSTCTRFLVQQLVAAGRRVALVDASVGIKSVGPPAAITLAYIEGTAEFRGVAAQAFYFVGSTSPVGRLMPIIVGTTRLLRAADAPFVIIDTCGYITETGRVLKTYKIDAVRPDLIVAIERTEELTPILGAHRHLHALRLRASPRARSKDVWEKDLARRKAFAHYFEGAKRHEMSLANLAVQRSLIFTGTPVAIEGALYAEETAEGLVVVSEKTLAAPGIVKTLKPGFDRGLLCGLADERGEGVGLAILENIDFGRRVVALMTPVPAEKVRVLQLGDMYLSLDGRELGRVPMEGF